MIDEGLTPPVQTAVTLQCYRCEEKVRGYVLQPWFCYSCRVIIAKVMDTLKAL